MTQSELYTLACGWCGAELKADIYHSVNVTSRPELKPKLFNRELNTARCESCGKYTRFPVPLLYHDMERKLLAYYFPREHQEVKELGAQKLKEKVREKMEGLGGEGYSFRVAVGWKEFLNATLWEDS